MLPQEQPTLACPSDTATPVTPIPIFYLHTEERPFCSMLGCMCHVNEVRLKELLQAILDGDLKLRKVYNGVIAGKGI